MGKTGRASTMASWRRLLLSAAACSALTLGMGFLMGSDAHGLGQPALLLLAFPAALFGGLARRMFLGALAAPLLGFAGGLGIVLRLCPRGAYWEIPLIIENCFGGLVCVVAGSLGGLAGDLSSTHRSLPPSQT